MVKKINDKGGVYHEPPYTWEEEMDFYQRVGGATSLTIYHSTPPAAPQSPPQKSPPQPPEE